MFKRGRSPFVAAASVLLVLTALGLLAGLVLTRTTGSWAAGVTASNVGMVVGLVLAWRVYRSENRS